jgi:hypothetical protein
MVPNAKLSRLDGPLLSDPTSYRRLVGRLLYLTITRSNLAHSVLTLSQFMDQLCQPHVDAAHRVLRYLKNNPGQGLFYSSTSDLRLKAFYDLDWVACPDTCRSLIGFFVFLGDSLSFGNPRNNKQYLDPQLKLSTVLWHLLVVLMWLSSLLQNLQVDLSQTTLLFCDSQVALHVAANPVYHERKSIPK